MEKFHETMKKNYKIILSAEKISRFIHFCEDSDEPTFMAYEKVFQNAEETLDNETPGWPEKDAS